MFWIGLSNAQGERISITPNLVSSNWEQLSIADAEGQIVLKQQRQLDELGRVVAQLGNAGQQTRIHYDKTGQAVRIDQHSGENKGNNQDNTNNQANAGDPSGVLSTVQHYDSLGRLTQHIDPAQGETHLKHNSNGQIRQVTAANDARTTYIYDGLGQLLQEHSPDTGTRIHHYDTAGQRIRSHGLEQLDQPELSAQHHYDALGRLIHIQAPDSADDVRYHYDQTGTEDDRNYGIGRLTAIEDRHSRIEYRYDRHGNLLSDHRTLNIDGQSHTQHTRYSYTQGNQLASITYPNGQRIDYHYRQGQADSITLNENRQQKILVSDIQYRPFGPVQQWRNGNGLSQQLEYDLDGRTSAVSVSNSKQEAVWQQHYQYDLLNNITGIERTENRKGTINSQQQLFSYDPVQRLIGDRGSYGEQQFTYDKVGNRLSHVRLKQQPALNDDSYADSESQAHREDYSYAPASNRLLGTSEKQILLDKAGNLLYESSDRNRAYNYNAQNRISEYYENGQLKARYHYNALGQRIHKAVIQNDGTEQHTLFHYGQQGELLGETHLADNGESSESSSSQNIVWLQMRPVVALDSSANSTNSTNSKPADTQISWLHSDHLLTARASTDANQNLIWRWHSDAFGVGEAESFTVNNGQSDESTEETFTLNLRFPGQYHDAESGLHYNYRRTYDPSMGRYTQSDPIGLMGGVNTFAYASGSPLIMMDLLGLCDEELVGAPITDEQWAYLASGDFLEFWRSRHLSGDPVARTALIGWRDPEFVGASRAEKISAGATWYALEFHIWQRDLSVTMEEIGLGLAEAHAEAVINDKTNVSYLLSPRQVADYHHEVFDKHGIGAYVFGGTFGVGVEYPSDFDITATWPFIEIGWEIAEFKADPNWYSGAWCKGCDTDPR